MAIFNKPEFNSVWANTGTKINPGTAKVNQGWVVEIPAHEHDNWILNRQDQMLAHLNQAGIPVWDATAEYVANKSYVQGISTGNIYRAVQTNTNMNPEGATTGFWVVAFEVNGSALLKGYNLGDVPDKASARYNLGIPTTADYDARYLIKSQNLADVPNKASARNILDVYSKQDVRDLIDLYTPAGEIAFFAMLNPPTGWLIADGRAVSRATYSKLFSAIGTLYGSGNGSTTFNLPDLRGEFVRGFDAGRNVDPGRVFATTQQDALQNHYHNTPVSNGIGGERLILGDLNQAPGVLPTGTVVGARTANETRPRNISMSGCISTGAF